jgi:hypothetical protein
LLQPSELFPVILFLFTSIYLTDAVSVFANNTVVPDISTLLGPTDVPNERIASWSSCALQASCDTNIVISPLALLLGILIANGLISIPIDSITSPKASSSAFKLT